MTWVLDLDGVVWVGSEPVAGSAEAVARLRAAGESVLFVSNNSSATLEQYRDKLAGAGIAVEPDDVITSAVAAATLFEPGSRALLLAGAGAAEALAARGVEVVADGDADAVVVGWHRDFDFDRLTAATRAVLRGARLVATNDDPTYPAPGGPVPGAGAILAAVERATGAAAEVAGKPYEPIVRLLRARITPGSVVAGDRASTDGRLARRLGARFGLVLSGITAAHDLPVEPVPDLVAPDLLHLVEAAGFTGGAAAVAQ